MGLDCSHDAFHCDYSEFYELRQFVREARMSVEDYSKSEWTGLYEFLSHSDCDGEITPEMCIKVADDLDRLMPIMEAIAMNQESYWHIAHKGGFIAVVKKFIAGCRAAAAENSPIYLI